MVASLVVEGRGKGVDIDLRIPSARSRMIANKNLNFLAKSRVAQHLVNKEFGRRKSQKKHHRAKRKPKSPGRFANFNAI
jgi:hypothetical protein